MPDPIPAGGVACGGLPQCQRTSHRLRTAPPMRLKGCCRPAHRSRARIVVHLLASREARSFYLHMGFDPSPIDPDTLLIRLRMCGHLAVLI